MFAQASSGGASALFVALLVGAAFGWVLWLRRRELASVRAGFVASGATDATVHELEGSVTGTLDGALVGYRVFDGGKSSPGNTVVESSVPTGLGEIEIHLSAQQPYHARQVERGLLVDLELGDAEFDTQVVVEAAPAAVVRAALDVTTRRKVLAQMPCTIDVERGTVRLRRVGKITEAPRVAELLATHTRLVARLIAAAREASEQQLAGLREASLGYRGVEPADARIVVSELAARDELANLHRVRRKRENRRAMVILALLAVCVALWAVFAFTIDRSHAQ